MWNTFSGFRLCQKEGLIRRYGLRDSCFKEIYRKYKDGSLETPGDRMGSKEVDEKVAASPAWLSGS